VRPVASLAARGILLSADNRECLKGGAQLRLIRNIFRRKLRAFLTIFGISIGIFALVVMGALAEKLTLLVEGGVEYYEGKVVVVGDSGLAGVSSPPLDIKLLREIEEVPGVARASAEASVLFDEEPASVNFGTISTVNGSDGRSEGYETFVITMAKGREIKSDDRGKVVLGWDLAKQLKAQVGGYVDVRSDRNPYEVVGIMDKTLTAPDNSAVMSMYDVQQLVADDLPDVVSASLNPETIATDFVAFAETGQDPERIATRIEDHVDGVEAVSPTDFEKQVKQPLDVFTSIIYAVALISLMVGGLSVINTMTMSVAERTKEIGVRKAIGASDGQIMGQFVAESGVMGLIGGIVGLGFGYVVATMGNAAGEASGNALFLVSVRLIIGSLAFAVVLGVVSGLYPAWHAARLNPVEALRYE